MNQIDNGKFVISLDFELQWGVRDKRSIEEYGQNIVNVHKVIPRLLDVFNNNGIKATFATLGFLFFESKETLLQNLPEIFPEYTNKNLSPYNGYFEKLGTDAKTDFFHFAPQLIKLIKQYPKQEIASHTFSHYYCLEPGQKIDEFKADIITAQKVALEQGIQLKSLVFPRNQYRDDYLEVCKEAGIISYRGNEHSWLYEARNGIDESQFRRALRLVDSYINISGHNCYSDVDLIKKLPVNIPASRFLRPYSNKLKALEKLRLRRIKTGMTYAAKNNLTYHLWWHPHNFGANTEKNFLFLSKIIDHYKYLNSMFNFQSYSMVELAQKLRVD